MAVVYARLLLLMVELILTGAPYSCEVWLQREGTDADGTARSSLRMVRREYRDSAGRFRVEVPVDGLPGVRRAAIWDLPGGVLYEVDYQRHAAVRMKADMRAVHSAVELREAPEKPGLTRKWLGKRVIDGVETEGIRFLGERERAEAAAWPYVISNRVEVWVVPDLGVRLLETKADSETGSTVTITRRHLVRGEPDAALFRVPEGFAMEEGGKAH